jgi:60 kDa SS-A/Ro ribonucleoprotein
MKYNKHVSLRNTPQTEPIIGKNMKPNNSGGFGFEITDEMVLDRFHILGTEGGTYYVGERKLTIDNVKRIIELIKNKGEYVVDRVVEISYQGRAPKNSPALFVLALCTSPTFADVNTRKKAFENMPKVARIPTHLFEFIGYMQSFRGWGRAAKNGIQNWYQSKSPEQLEFHMVKYRQRDGWTHNDVLRLAKPVPIDAEHDMLYEFAKKDRIDRENNFKLIEGYIKAKEATTEKEIVSIIRDYNIPMEAIPTQFKNSKEVWSTILPNLPITATIRNLRNMAIYGVLNPFSENSKMVASRISDRDIIRKGRVHPIQFLNAIMTYPVGETRVFQGGMLHYKGNKKDNTSWVVDKDIVEALNVGFSHGFDNVEPSNKRILVALDISGSMGWQPCLGMRTVNPREASAALSLITVNTEPNHMIGVFTREFRQFTGIKSGMDINSAINAISGLNFGGTNITSPIEWLTKHNLEVDAIFCYTDNETYWYGSPHPCQALEKYRQRFGINTKFVTVSMCANRTTVADPNDPNMLDIVGFDTATPKIISEYLKM